MLTIQQKRNLEKAVRAAVTAPSASNPITTAAEVTAAQAAVAALQPWEQTVGNVVQVKSGFGAGGVKVDEIEFASGEAAVNGNWKMSLSGDDIDASRRESGTWVEKGGFIA